MLGIKIHKYKLFPLYEDNFGSVANTENSNLGLDHTVSTQMGTLSSKDNSLTLIAAMINNNLGLDIFEDVYCFK